LYGRFRSQIAWFYVIALVMLMASALDNYSVEENGTLKFFIVLFIVLSVWHVTYVGFRIADVEVDRVLGQAAADRLFGSGLAQSHPSMRE